MVTIWQAATTIGLTLVLAGAAHADDWEIKSVPNPQGGRSVCVVESVAKVIDDGYSETPVRVRIGARLVQVVTESDIDVGFGDVGLRIDDGPLARPDAVQVQQNLLYTRTAARLIAALPPAAYLNVDLRFWPTWPSHGRRSVAFALDGIATALGRLGGGC
jgi:hypothetical protein